MRFLLWSCLAILHTSKIQHVHALSCPSSRFLFRTEVSCRRPFSEAKNTCLCYSPSSFDNFLDYDDEDEDEDSKQISRLTTRNTFRDLSGSTQRQFTIGSDIILISFAGSLGFDEVTDWEYYKEEVDEDTGERGMRYVVQPSPFDPNTPKRTRSSSGSVVRLYRGELAGKIGSTLRSRGLDRRVLVKEFSGEQARSLAKAELQSISRIQSAMCAKRDDGAKRGDWASSAATRYIMGKINQSTKDDDANLVKLVEMMSNDKKMDPLPHVGILGELNLDDYHKNPVEKNSWYQTLGVRPPDPECIFLVYEYAGLNTLGNYAQPALKRWSSMPMTKGIWGNLIPPPSLPPWNERAKYVVRGILKGALEALATLHENGIAHRSIGLNSIILSSVGMDKMEAASPLAVVPSRLKIKLTDFGFSDLICNSGMDEKFRGRARAFQVNCDDETLLTNFAMAEDLHALGFVFLGVILTSLAVTPTPQYTMPALDEDTLQRLLADIFDKNMNEFREYCDAEDIWNDVVALLDESNGAGWKLLSDMCFARERAADKQGEVRMSTARELLSSPLFGSKR